MSLFTIVSTVLVLSSSPSGSAVTQTSYPVDARSCVDAVAEIWAHGVVLENGKFTKKEKIENNGTFTVIRTLECIPRPSGV